MKKKLTIKLGKVKFRKKWNIPPGGKVIVDRKQKLSERERREIKIKLRRGNRV